jgi:predicted RNA binding protein YcfA (HicA-like mRNA interferase family)
VSKLPVISSKEMSKILNKVGFYEIHQRGSHIKFQHEDGRVVIIPFHNDDLGRGLIRKILKEIKISISEYLAFLKN